MSEVKVGSRLAEAVYIKTQNCTGDVFGVVINRGAEHGVKLGERFLVFGIGPYITDSDTGVASGVLELVRGQAVAVHLQEHISTTRSAEGRRTRPAKRVVVGPSGSPENRLLRLVCPEDLGRSYFGCSGNIIKEDLSPEEEVLLESVQLGDYVKPV